MAQSIEQILQPFARLLPSSLALDGQLGTDVSLALPEEHAYAERMVASRAEEFLTGRTCARRTLRRLGWEDQELLPRPNRAPAWPEGARGSISHTKGICIVALGEERDLYGVGVDVERRLAVAEKLQQYIATPREIDVHRGIDDWRTILFSVKESVFKCLNPPTGLWLEFRDVEVTAIGETEFSARVTPKDEDTFEVEGVYIFSEEYVLSAVVLAAPPR